MKKRSIIPLLLIIAAILFSSCGNNNLPLETTESSEAVTEATSLETGSTTSVTTGTEESGIIPERPYSFPNAYTFSFFNNSMLELFKDANGERVTEIGREFGELIDGIEKELEINIECKLNLPDISFETLAKSFMSGSCPQDLMNTDCYCFIAAIFNGYIMPVDTLVSDYGLDVSWESSLYESSVIAEKHWGLDFTGRYTNSPIGYFYAFNTELVDNSGIMTTEQLYETIWDYKWDYDTFLNLARKIAADTDNDGKLDIFGLALHAEGHEAGTNGKNIINYVDGSYVADLSDPQLEPAFNFMALICKDDISQLITEDGFAGRSNRRTAFYTGKAGFTGLNGDNITDPLGACTATFQIGVAPLPMGPNATGYHMDRSGDLNFVLSNNKNPEAVVQVLNVLGPALTNEELYLEEIREGIGCDENGMVIFMDYLIPYQRYYLEECSRSIYFDYSCGRFIDEIYRADLTVEQTVEKYQKYVQNELHKVFLQ